MSPSASHPDPGELPRLALVYHPHSFSVFALRAAARDVCQLTWVVDTTIPGTEAMLAMLRRMGGFVDIAGLAIDAAAQRVAAERPDGILTLKDSLMETTARLAEQLDLPFHTPAVAARFTDKLAQRTALATAGLPVPGFWPAPPRPEGDAWVRLCDQVRLPAIVKPRLGNEGSRDTIQVRSLGELAEALAGIGPDTPYVIEEYLGDRDGEIRAGFGDYVSVETLVCDGEMDHLAITGRFPPAVPFRETGFFIPAELSTVDRADALRVAGAAVAALGVRRGVLHTEIKFTPDGPRVIELNGRIGGGVPEMMLDACDIDLLPLALRLALGEPVRVAGPVPTRCVAYLLYVQAPERMRQVTRVDGLRELAEDPAVSEVILNRGPGQAVHWREGNHGHVFSVRGVVADHDALLALEQRVHDEVVGLLSPRCRLATPGDAAASPPDRRRSPRRQPAGTAGRRLGWARRRARTSAPMSEGQACGPPLTVSSVTVTPARQRR